jgi:hypothetical protein
MVMQANTGRTQKQIERRRFKMTTTPQHCPGWESFKDLKSFICKCNTCGAEKEIFSDEFNKTHICAKCNTAIDFTACSYEAGGGDSTPR